MVPIKMPPKATIWLLAVGGEWSEAETTDLNAPPIIMVPIGAMDVPPHSNQESLDADVTDIVADGWRTRPRTTGSHSRPRPARPSSLLARRTCRERRGSSWSSRNRMEAGVWQVLRDRRGQRGLLGRLARRVQRVRLEQLARVGPQVRLALRVRRDPRVRVSQARPVQRGRRVPRGRQGRPVRPGRRGPVA
jgi:hypothetical protein